MWSAVKLLLEKDFLHFVNIQGDRKQAENWGSYF
jgi:hypothetical protein